MGLFSIFSGKSPETHEQRGDKFIEIGAYGDARIEYENALHKIETKFPEKAPLIERIRQKMTRAGEFLARAHMENADILVNAGDYQEALELFQLAMDLAEDENLKNTVSKKIHSLIEDYGESDISDSPVPGATSTAVSDDALMELVIPEDASEDELFSVLCHAVPESVENAYHSYGDAFKQGYIALNQGEFEMAVELLTGAMEENARPNLIALELATAHIHLQDYDNARELLESFLREHPEDIRAYQLLCEIYWDTRDYDKADRLLAGCPDTIRENPPILLLLGETRFQEKAYDAAESVFNRYIAINGQDEIVSRSLAKTLEARGDLEAARELYAQTINQCTSCQKRVDPFLKRRYAELSFQAGDTSTKLLDIYLALAQEDPANRSVYYQRIAGIYEKKGDMLEARRYAAFGSEAR